MKLVRYGTAGHEVPCVLEGEVAYDLRTLTADIDAAFLASDFISAITAALEAGRLPVLDVTGQRIGAPVARPGKVVCIGLNYRDHAAETGASIPTEPIVFMKDPMTVIGPNDPVVVPRGSVKTDWEVELAVVIGSVARYCDDRDAAAACIAGYAVANDVSEREFQLERGGQWDKGKSCETFNPLGPWLVTPDEVSPDAMRLRLDVNGQTRQDGSTTELIFDVHEVVRYLSQFMVLYPGDVINTGTPAGVALAGHAPFLRPGDVMELSIDGLGSQRQTVEAAA